MIIVDICGGLGNQMFQYALYCELIVNGKEAMISLRHFEDIKNGKWKNIPLHGKCFLLDDIFNIEYQVATREEVEKLGSVGSDFFSRMLSKLGCRKQTHIKEELLKTVTKQTILSFDNAFLEGYWQNFALFEEANEMIRNQYKFKRALTGKNYELSKKIETTQSVSIHVRRGDYLKNSLYASLDEEYYLNAIDYMKKYVDNVVLYCFSDDIEWCKNVFKGYEINYIDWNNGKDSYIDMQLMSMCKHNIIANSSFSVWAAWLNSNKEKIIVRPQLYYSDIEKSNKYPWPKDWHAC